jgi:hypothetical protein
VAEPASDESTTINPCTAFRDTGVCVVAIFLDIKSIKTYFYDTNCVINFNYAIFPGGIQKQLTLHLNKFLVELFLLLNIV